MQTLSLHGHMKPITQVKYNRDGDLIFSTAKEGVVTMWRSADGERLGTFEGQKTVAACDVNWSSTMLATAGFDLTTKIYNVLNGDCLGTIDHISPCRATQFAHDDSKLMTVTGGRMGEKPTISIYNLPETIGLGEPAKAVFNPFAQFTVPEDICYAEWGPTNETIYFCSQDGSVSILDVETMTEKVNKIPHSDEIRKIHFDSNFYTLITASKDKSAKLLDSRTLATIQTYNTDDPVNDATISPICDHVIVGGGVEAQDVTVSSGSGKFEVKFFHKVQGGAPLGSHKCHFGTINTMMYHPNGKSFASGGFDGIVKLHTFDQSYFASVGATPCWTP